MHTGAVYLSRESGKNSDTIQKFTAGEARNRAAAIITTNRKADATLITQLSDEDTITLEISGGTTIMLASMYFDRQRPLEHGLTKVDEILQHAEKVGSNHCNR